MSLIADISITILKIPKFENKANRISVKMSECFKNIIVVRNPSFNYANDIDNSDREN